MHWFTDVIKQYATFSGRARRKEFWMFVLFSWIISIIVNILDRIIGTDSGNGGGLLGSIFSLAILIPSLAVAARRLHDTGRSAYWLFLILAIVVGWIVLLVFYVQEGNPGDNEYGPDPKAAERGAGGFPQEPGYPGYPPAPQGPQA
ncbi:DUF805 domain-containing protein [Streptomyces sp. SID13031]|uniref:DUF805 domain-containing protein n=1 Tax=Streptomyces sp. SID13031 TaxID=2706046 RepID=UPI0013C8BA63|nr:DUF805 domain-containing protein [Streptomyces sp. SID13031]